MRGVGGARARGQGELHPRDSPGAGEHPRPPVPSVPGDELPSVSRLADRVQLLRRLRGHEISPV